MKIIDGLYVYNSEEIKTTTQVAIVKTNLGFAYKTVLEYSNGVIKCWYLDYKNDIVDFNNNIIFEFNGEQISVLAVSGIAEIPFEIVDSGTYIVKTVNPDIENGEVIING